MSKKLAICAGKACKKLNSTKLIKQWSEELIIEGQISKIKKVKCLGTCKKGFAVKFGGELYSCFSKEELEKIVTKKKKVKKK